MSVRSIHQLTRPEGRPRARTITIAETGCDRNPEYLPIPPGKPVERPTPDHPDGQWAVVHDIVGLGPAGFDKPTLERFAGCATHLALVCSEADSSIYRVFASAPIAHVCWLWRQRRPFMPHGGVSSLSIPAFRCSWRAYQKGGGHDRECAIWNARD
jgi:hypothetical protein